METRIVGENRENQNNQIWWTDVLYIPVAYALYYALAHWLPRSLAVALSALVALLFFSLFEPRQGSFKRYVIAVLGGAAVGYIYSVLFSWPP